MESEVSRAGAITNSTLLASVIADSMNAVAIVTDAPDIFSSHIVYANEACAVLLGSEEMLFGRTTAKLLGERPDDLPAVLRAWAARDGRPVSMGLVRPKGERIDVELQITRVHSASSVAYFAVVVRDLTERNRERAESETERLTRERMTSVAYLAEGAAYEIHNPLSRLLASIELAQSVLRAEPSNDGALDMGVIERSLVEALEGGRRIQKLVDGLHALAKDERGNADPFDVHESLELALELLAAQVGNRARLTRDYAALPLVQGHFARLTQAFMDILTNAVEAIPPGSPAANRVTVQTSLDSSGRATVLISDTGVGIEPADLPHVFEPFFTSKPRPVSTGLGLATARGAILASRGDISIESDLGRGTRVKVTLETVAVAPVKTATLRASVRPRQFMLVVDREPRVCAALARLLENDRTTFAYATPDDALERIMLGRAPDLIVLAIRDDEPQGFSFRDSLERAMPDFASRVVEIALPEENVTSEGRPRLHSSTQLSTVSRSRVSA